MLPIMVQGVSSLLKWEFVAITAIATGVRLQVGEAITVVSDKGLPNKVPFYRGKSRRGWQPAALRPYPQAWAKFLGHFRDWNGLPRPHPRTGHALTFRL